jgi:hypothetical membrane protein
MRPASLLLKLGVLVPVVYFGVLLIAGYLTPGFNHFTQYASELGMAGKPAAQLFNYGMIAAGGLILAVTGPIAYLQKVVFEAYITSRAPSTDTLTTTTTIRSEPPKA